MHFGVSYRSIWRQRVVGSLLVLPVEVVLCLMGLLPLRGVQLLVFAVLFVVYLAALRAHDGRSAVAWPVYLCEGVALALFIRETGGAASPFQVLVYPWTFGSALTLLLDGLRPTVVPRLALFTALTLVVGAWSTEGFVLFAVVNALALASMTAALMTLNLERRAARVDALLPMVLNRSAGLEQLESWVGAKRAFHLLFIDLGEFKKINDTYGHRVGDEVLWAVAERLRNAVRATDIVIRYGGDEFVVATMLDTLGERLKDLFDVPVQTSAGAVQVQADVGNVPCLPGDDLSQLLHHADTSMYRKKRSRRELADAVAPRSDALNVPYESPESV